MADRQSAVLTAGRRDHGVTERAGGGDRTRAVGVALRSAAATPHPLRRNPRESNPHSQFARLVSSRWTTAPETIDKRDRGVHPWSRTTPSGSVAQRSSNSLDGRGLRGWESNPRVCRLTAGRLTVRRPRNTLPGGRTGDAPPGSGFFEHAAALGRRGASHDQVFTERREPSGRSGARCSPDLNRDGCQSWVRTRASRVRAGDPSAGPTGKARHRQDKEQRLPDLGSNQGLPGQSRGSFR